MKSKVPNSITFGCSLKKCLGMSRREGHDKELDLHLSVARFLDFCLTGETYWHHSPNEGKRHVRYTWKLSQMGTKWGFPDIVLFFQGRAFSLELKSRYGTMSDSQVESRAKLASAGCPYGVARTLEEVAGYLSEWGIPLRISLAEFKNLTRIDSTVARELLASAARQTIPRKRPANRVLRKP